MDILSHYKTACTSDNVMCMQDHHAYGDNTCTTELPIKLWMYGLPFSEPCKQNFVDACAVYIANIIMYAHSQ